MQNPQQPFGQQPGQSGYGSPIPNPTGEMSGYGTGGTGGPMMGGPNTSGQGAAAVVPPEVANAGFNWGAGFVTFFWSIAHSAWLGMAIIAFSIMQRAIPVVGLLLMLGFQVFMGMKGNELGWRNRKWDDVAHFQRTQKVWAIWGKILFGLTILGVIGGFMAANTARNNPQLLNPQTGTSNIR